MPRRLHAIKAVPLFSKCVGNPLMVGFTSKMEKDLRFIEIQKDSLLTPR